MDYHFKGEENIDSPSLVYYKDVITENIGKAIGLAGNAGRLWPHVKTHKTSALLKMQIERGIGRFKCATIAEAELCAMNGAANVLVAYPLVGPAVARFVKLRNKYPQTTFWALGDNLLQFELLSKAVLAEGKGPVNALIDVNMGMNRTGVLPEKLEGFYLSAKKLEGLSLKGFHCYDGHIKNNDLRERLTAVSSSAENFWQVKKSLETKGNEIPVLVMGGTPTFSCHRETKDVFLSPGTFFVQDYHTEEEFSDLAFTPGAAILSRVVSHPKDGYFTIDTGSKAIATDPAERGIIADLPKAKAVFQSEEHWVWELKEGAIPPIGTIVYVLPGHICPTSALYPGVIVVESGKQSDYWEVGARNRKITV